MAVETAIRTYRNLIGGEWTESASGRTFESANPARRSDIVGRFQASVAADVEQAIAAADKAFPAWKATPPGKRAELLYKAADLLEADAAKIAEEITREEGKPLAAAKAEAKRSAQTLRYYASEGLNIAGATLASDDPTTFVYTKKEPLGVVSVITPWNFPLSIPARKIAPALAAGNTVVFKPASDTPLVALRLAEALHAAGLPPGVLNFVTGPASATGATLVSHPAIKAVTFTGSTASGESIRRSARLSTRLQMELGGKNPLLVLEDADIGHAVELAIKGGFELTGQACTGTSRIIVMERVHDEFVERLVEAAKALVVGSGLAAGADIGPLANESQLRNVLDYIEIGKAEGARLAFGGEWLREGEYAEGYYVRPAIFAGAKPEMRIAREEIFGPVLAVLKAKCFKEAVRIANDAEYGLSASIVTSDYNRMQYFIDHIQSGVVKVNRTTTGNAINAPFGGVKLSSTATFRESGRDALDFYTCSKTVYHGVQELKFCCGK